MVDFQIKLQDNRVAEWSDHYMSYAALKKILKKAKNAEQKYIFLNRYKTSRPANEFNGSYGKYDDDDGISVDTSVPTTYSQDDLASVATEETMLLTRSRRSEDDMVGNSFSVKNALGNISDLFNGDVKNRNAKRLEYALKDMDHQIEAFDLLFHDEQKKVVSFYYDTLDDLEERLEFVKSSVAKAFGIQIDEGSCDLIAPSSGDGRRTSSPFVTQGKQHRKTLSMDDVVEGLLTTIVGDGISNTVVSRRKTTSRKTFENRSTFNNHDRIQLPTIQRHSVGESNRNAKNRPPRRSHKRGVSNIRLGHLLQEDGEDEELNFRSASAYGDGNQGVDFELEEKRAADAGMIKRFLVSQYRVAKYLHNYAMMNITGFVKIAKKFDKTIPSHAGRFQSALETRNMMDDADEVETLTKRYEQHYANWFCEGDVRAAKVQMLSKKGDVFETDWSQLRLGYRMGICAVLAVWICWDCIWGVVHNGNSPIVKRSTFPIFRACGGLLLLQWYWGCSVFVWSRYRINYIFLFDFIPSTITTPFDIFCAAVDNTLIFMLLLLLYYKAGADEIPDVIPTNMYPLILILMTICKLLFPIRQRRLMWQTVYEVVSSPLYSPTFFHTYVGDIFTSMVKVFQDIAFSITWLAAGSFLASEDSDVHIEKDLHKTFWYKSVIIPLVTMMPLVIRFNQCLRKFWDSGDRFPHLANASKYALSSLVTLFGIFHPLYLEYNHGHEELNYYQIFWTFIFVLSSLFSYAWDVFLDWGLGRREHAFLNQPLMYPQKSYYYFTIVIDLILRFLWVLTLVPPDSGASFALPEYLTSLSMMLELSRRTLWGFFRLENEHRNNENTYRRKGFVPLHFHTGHIHKYKDKKERAGSEVLRELLLVTVVVGIFCFGTIAAAQHANDRLTSYATIKEL